MNSQLNHFYASQFTYAAQMHERMAEFQEKAGLHRLAADSRKTAMARRISAANVEMGVSESLDFGQWAADTVKKGAI